MVDYNLREEIVQELVRQITDGNGRSTDATMGMTLRELFLESREDIKEIKKVLPTFVTRKELIAASFSVALVVIAIIRFFI